MGFRFLERLDYSSYYSYMEKATISEIKNRLSAYLRKVRAGETVLILDRNHPVARLEQVDRQSQPESRTALLERDGLLKRSTQPIPMEMLRSPAPRPKRSAVAALIEEREKGR